MAKQHDDEDDDMMVAINTDEGEKIETQIVTIFEAGGRDYIALLPVEGEDAEEGEVYLYRYSEDEDGNPDIENIETDDEFEIAQDAFDEWLDAQEYDELVTEDDDELE